MNAKKSMIALVAAMCSMAGMANTYTGNLTVTVNNVSSSQSGVSINVEQQSDGTYNLTLSNFTLVANDQTMPVGNIALTGIKPATTASGTTVLTYNDTTTIKNGTDTNVTMWLGPMLGPVPLQLITRFNTTGQMATTIDIDMKATLGQVINVKFDAVGDAYQLPNAGFEDFVASSGEPLHWHGFKSASGSLASMASSTLASSTDVRPGSTGTKSAVVGSTSIFGIVANGTMTTGRLNAAAISATDTKNHSEMDMSSTATDKNGDPFYISLNGKPDSVKVWLKFTQGTANASYPYATFSAVITDGTYYQDPEDKAYTNVAAKAANKEIATGDWRELAVPFDYATYAANNAAAKGLLITISTNATPGQGSKGDQVWADDISLVYDAALTGLSYKGTNLGTAAISNVQLASGETPTAADITATLQGAGAEAATLLTETATGYQAVVTVVSADLLTAKSYVINFNVPSIDSLKAVNALDDNTKFIFNGKAVAVYQHGDYLYVHDNSGASLIYGAQSATFTKGQVLSAGWSGTKTTVDGWKKLIDVTGLSASGETATVKVDSTIVGDPAKVTDDLQNQWLQLHWMVVTTASNAPAALSKAEGTATSFTISNNPKVKTESTLAGYNLFGIDMSALTTETNGQIFDLEGFVGYRNGALCFYPTALDYKGTVTGVTGVNAAKAVKSVSYYNLAGQTSAQPFEGVNIVRTTYTDGTTSVAKVMK